MMMMKLLLLHDAPTQRLALTESDDDGAARLSLMG